jgi:hypothetical protein
MLCYSSIEIIYFLSYHSKLVSHGFKLDHYFLFTWKVPKRLDIVQLHKRQKNGPIVTIGPLSFGYLVVTSQLVIDQC